MVNEDKPFIVLKTKVEDGVIWVYGFLDDGIRILHKSGMLTHKYDWYKLTPNEEKESA